MSDRYLVCGCTPWARRVFDKRLSKLPGTWQYVASPEELDYWVIPGWSFIFFLHWRWKVPKEITDRYECIGFHLGELPSQGGGSPVQWRILEAIDGGTATLSMFRMTTDLDAGPTIGRAMILLDGTAEAVYARCMDAAAAHIEGLLARPHWYIPQEKTGEPHTYPRRRPEESRIPLDFPNQRLLGNLYDHIRCVDAEGYPHAFLDYGGLRFTFRRAVEYDGRIEADVTITELPRD